ncbi:hypothetical protein Tco_1396304 [Tanacetum coccineum]
MEKGAYALSWKPCQEVSSKLNLSDHRSVLTEPEVQTLVLQSHSSKAGFITTHSNSSFKSQTFSLKTVVAKQESLEALYWEIVSLDEEEEFTSFQDEYEYIGQKHKMIKKIRDNNNWEKHEEVDASYADLKWIIEDFYTTTFRNYENIDASLRNYERILDKFRSDHVTGLNWILKNLQEVQSAVKEDTALNKRVLEAAKAYTKKSTNLTELLIMVKNFDFPNLKTIVKSLLAAVTTQNDHLAKWVESCALMA